MIGRWIWIGWLVIVALGCGEVTVRPFVEPTDAGMASGPDGSRDGGDDDDDGGPDDDDGGIDDDDDGGIDDDAPRP